MTLQELKAVLAELGLHPSRRLGQNFLIDGNLRRWIVADAAPQPGELVVEVGPGLGVLTAPLLAAGVELLAIEFDRRLAAYLERTLGGAPGLRLLAADAVAVDYDALTAGRPWRVIANLPYAVCGPLFGRWLALANPPRALHLLVQRELGERLAAAPGTKAYGALSVRVQLAYAVERRRLVPPTVFWPQPAVASAALRLALRPARPAPALQARLERLLRLGFGQRRKRLHRLLQPEFTALALAAAFAALGLGPDVRAEGLTPAQFLALAAAAAD